MFDTSSNIKISPPAGSFGRPNHSCVFFTLVLALSVVVSHATFHEDVVMNNAVRRRLAYRRECSLNAECAHLEGDCCPDSQGKYLDCCPGPSCADFPGCANLEGNCCPTDQGQLLNCCHEAPPTDNPTRKPTERPSPDLRDCIHYQMCGGLEGYCCPDVEGLILTCCDGIVNDWEDPGDPEPGVEIAMEDEKQIKGQGMVSAERNEDESAASRAAAPPTDDDAPIAAPTPQPSPMPVVATTSTEAAAAAAAGAASPTQCIDYPACSDAKGPFEGDCCPSGDGIYMECCSNEEEETGDAEAAAAEEDQSVVVEMAEEVQGSSGNSRDTARYLGMALIGLALL